MENEKEELELSNRIVRVIATMKELRKEIVAGRKELIERLDGIEDVLLGESH